MTLGILYPHRECLLTLDVVLSRYSSSYYALSSNTVLIRAVSRSEGSFARDAFLVKNRCSLSFLISLDSASTQALSFTMYKYLCIVAFQERRKLISSWVFVSSTTISLLDIREWLHFYSFHEYSYFAETMSKRSD